MEFSLNGDWGNRNDDDFQYQIAFDFIGQLMDIMEAEGWDRKRLATEVGVSKGRVSQFLNDPGNITLRNVVKYARALKRKVAIIAYDDNDPANKNGPIPPQVFVECWASTGKPADMFSLHQAVTVSTGQERLPIGFGHQPISLDNIDEEQDAAGEMFAADPLRLIDYARTNVL